MQRHHAFAALMLVLVGSLSLTARDAGAQEWATKMFSETSHNFGTVVRGAKVEYRFQFNNPYKEAVHVAGVSSSCGCTTPEVSKSDLATYERGEIIAKFNTRAFTGKHAATLTVTIDKPYYATVQLNVSGEIRGDIEVTSADSNSGSGQVEFGTVDQGELRERRMTITRYGRSDWQIVDVRSVNTSYEVEVVDGPRSPGKVSYELVVRLKKDAAPGYIHDPLILVTNDSQVPQFPIEVEGMIKAQLSVNSPVLAMGTVEAGQQVSKPLIVTGQKPFKIVAVHCDDDSFSFKIPAGAAKMRMIPVTFAAPNKPGRIVTKIQIETDLGKTLTLEVLAQAQVTPAPGPAPAATNDSPEPKPETKSPVNTTPINTTVKETAPSTPATPSEPATGNVIKLDTSTDNVPAGGSVPTKNPTDSKVPPPTPAATPAGRPASVMPNPIRPNSDRPLAGTSAAVS